MRKSYVGARWIGAVLVAACLGASAFAQDPQQYPQIQPAPQQTPPPSQQYPPPGQYPPQQGQYPPQQGQYPPQQGQYPPNSNSPAPYPSGQYPPPAQYGQPPSLPPQQLDQLVQPIALYPDGLLAQVLTAASFSNQIPDAAGWANAHSYIHGDQLAQAIREDNLPFDISVQALLPFPQILNYMAQYMGWTQQLGNAVLAQRPDVMDAIQRMRQQAYNYGYLRSGQYDRIEVASPGNIQIVPIDPGIYYVPYYNPAVVFFPPRPGFFVGGGIRFGASITIGAAFAPWGWGHVGFGWPQRAIVIDNHPWERTWVNRGAYAHPYAAPPPRYAGPRVEHHDVYGHEQHNHH